MPLDNNNFENWPITDTRPRATNWAFDAPNMTRHNGFNMHQYKEDLNWFDENRKRNAFIRFSLSDFPPSIEKSLEAKLPTLWVAVIRIAPGWHFRLPIWRGGQPYYIEPTTDEEIMTIIAECRSEGGYAQAASQQ